MAHLTPRSVQCAHHADVILLVAAGEDLPPAAEEGHQLQARLLGGVHGAQPINYANFPINCISFPINPRH